MGWCLEYLSSPCVAAIPDTAARRTLCALARLSVRCWFRSVSAWIISKREVLAGADVLGLHGWLGGIQCEPGAGKLGLTVVMGTSSKVSGSDDSTW